MPGNVVLEVAPVKDTSELTEDEAEVLESYRRAKELRFADINIGIQDGIRVKLWLTEKRR